VPNHYIYVQEEGRPDYSRWLNVTARPQGGCFIQLGELCHPGRLSKMTSFICDLVSLTSAAQRGALQVTVPKGYAIFRREDEFVHIEFRGYDDAAPSRVQILADELLDRLSSLDTAVATPAA
jgi:hypothetical protein